MNNKNPKVSVVIPCYNAHAYLKKAIDSIKKQTFKNYEIILINDGSDNIETLNFIETIEDDIKVITQENRGLPSARNAGFKAARGDFVLPLDCDDWLEPQALERLLERIEEENTNTYIVAQMQMEGEGFGVLWKKYNFFEQLFLNQLPYCMLVRKNDWATIGGYDESMRTGYEDWEFNIRLGIHGIHGVFINEPLFHYRLSKSGMLLSLSGKAHAEIWAFIRNKHKEIYSCKNLIKLWVEWRGASSTYPLIGYVIWLACARLLPNKIVSRIFGMLRRYSQSKRVTNTRKNSLTL